MQMHNDDDDDDGQRLQAGSLLTQGHSQWKAEKSGDQDTEGHLPLSGHTDTQMSDVLREQTHDSRSAHPLCLLSTAIQSPGPGGRGGAGGIGRRGSRAETPPWSVTEQ